jgi:hypothetical protein
LYPRDGAITFIPPLAAAGHVFDDSVARKAATHSRHGGKQLLASVNVAGHTVVLDKPPPVEWMADPFLDRSAVTAKLRRQQRARSAASVPPSLRTRKAFRPTHLPSTIAAAVDADVVYTSTVADREMGGEELAKLATESRSYR